MSTTGNEYEQDEAPTSPPTMGEPAPDAKDAASATGDDGGSPEPATPPAPEPSHEAVGVGVVEDAADHHGQDGGRDTQSAGEAQRTPGALGTEQEQRLPAMAQNNASDVEKVAGIVAQTRQDLGSAPLERVAEVLRQRLTESGVELPEHDIEELARQATLGDADGPADPGRGPAD